MKNNIIIKIIILTFFALIFVIAGTKINISCKKIPFEKKVHIKNIKKIEILENDSIKISVKRKNLNWLIKDSLNVRDNILNSIINVINNLEIIQPVPLSYINSSMKNFENYKRTIIIYNKLLKKLELNFYFDTTYKKTICYLGKKPDKLYFVKIIGEENENLLNFIPISEDIYIDKVLISLYPEQIKKIKIEYFKKETESFEIQTKGKDNFEFYAIYPSYINIKKENLDIQKIKDYFYYFYLIKYEEADFKRLKKDEPIANLYIEDISGGIRKISLFSAKNIMSKEIDKNLCLAEINDKKFVVVNYYDIDPILRELNEFLKK